MHAHFFTAFLCLVATFSNAASERISNVTSLPNFVNFTDEVENRTLSAAVVTTEGDQLKEVWPDVLGDCNAVTLEMCEQESNNQTAIWDITCYVDTSNIHKPIRLCSTECLYGKLLKCEDFCPGKPFMHLPLHF